MTTSATSSRQRWIAVLACAERDSLRESAERACAKHSFDTLRAAEVGLAMVRGRMDGGGDRFNLGEATLSRCVMRLRSAGMVTVGVGYHLGRDLERVRWMAQLDALLQHPLYQAELLRSVIDALAHETSALRANEAASTETSRVEFFTLQTEVVR